MTDALYSRGLMLADACHDSSLRGAYRIPRTAYNEVAVVCPGCCQGETLEVSRAIVLLKRVVASRICKTSQGLQQTHRAVARKSDSHGSYRWLLRKVRYRLPASFMT